MRKTLLSLVVVAVLAAPAAATETGFYVGAGLGVSSVDMRDFNPDYAGLRFEDDELGFKLFGGFRLLKYFALEASYVDFGNVKAWEGGNIQVYAEANVGISMWSGYAVGLVPVSDKVDFFGKLGYASYDVDSNATASGETEDRSDSGSDLAYGLGVNFLFKKFGARIECDWLKIPDTGGAFLISASLTYNF